jgi:hypothetical protein
MTQSLKQSPPLQIGTTSGRSNRIPSYLITTTSSKTDLWIPSQRPRPFRKSGLIGRALAGSGPERRLPWTPERGRPRRRPTPPVNAGLKLHDITPLLLTVPKLQTVQRVRSPLSQSLWPARPPEEGERGADGQTRTLKEKEGSESNGKAKTTLPDSMHAVAVPSVLMRYMHF